MQFPEFRTFQLYPDFPFVNPVYLKIANVQPSSGHHVLKGLQCITDIPNDERIQEKLEKFLEKKFEFKTTNDIMYDNFCKDILINKGDQV